MSVSILEAPDNTSNNKISAVERPIFWEVQSDRNNADTRAVSFIDGGGGFVIYTVALHSYQVGDVILATGMEAIQAIYNGRQTVTEIVSGTKIKTDKAVDQVGPLTASVVRSNDNFRIKATLYKGNLDHGVISLGTSDSGNAQFTVGTAIPTIAVNDTIAISDTTKSFNITTVGDDGGKVEFTIISHGILQGDVVTIAGEAPYNGEHYVVSVTGTTVVTDADFISGGAGSGTLDYNVYDGLHTILTVGGGGTLFTTTTGFKDVVFAGSLIEVSSVGAKRQQEITVDGVNLFRFNVANFIKSQLSFDLATISAGNEIISPTTGSITNYTITFTEQFDDKDGLVTDGASIQSSVDYKGANIALQHTATQNLNEFTVGNNTKRFLTTTPSGLGPYPIYVVGDIIQLAFLYDEELTIQGRVEEYNDAPSLLNVDNSPLVTIEIDRGIFKIDTSAFLAATTSVVVKLINSASGVRSENYRFDLDKKCRDRAQNIVWLNRLGGFDSYRFTGDLLESVTTRKTSYEKGLGKNFIVSDRGDSIIGSKSYDVREIWSDWILESEAAWLSELYTSKHVYLVEDVDGSNEYVPIVVTDRKQLVSQSRELVQLRVKYKRPELRING